MRLENKVAFISGGARGMGAVEARLFAEEGCRVAIGDLREDEGQQIEAEINETGGECLYLRLDVTSEENWLAAIAATVARFGKLDILVNNAGIYRTERVEETSVELWDQVADFLLEHPALFIYEIGGGKILNLVGLSYPGLQVGGEIKG